MKDIYNFDPEHTFFTSDTHFGHAKIIEYCNRPFKSVEEMNEKLIENWNNTVSDGDVIFHLGDIALGGSSVWNSILPRLNGCIYLIKGNHDMKNLRNNYTGFFKEIHSQMQIHIEKRSIYLNHFPFLCYSGSYRNSQDAVYQLFGHVHSGPVSVGEDDDRLGVLFPFQYDVGVDNNNYAPVSWRQVESKIEDNLVEAVLTTPIELTVPNKTYKL